ncbi:hypothetical protein [Paracoccus sp. J55]|uniref:hypothetical protein n=1 Tax=Paracoccus sp. J55 TaxID=935849 RepID=UPI0004B274F5|nr:hypothetical protein [Paracoccus sp. J55]
MSKPPCTAVHAPDLPALTGAALHRLAMTALLLQVRAGLQGGQPGPVCGRGTGAMEGAAAKAEADLRAMSRYCLDHLLPRTRSLLVQAGTLARGLAAPPCEAAQLPALLKAAAGDLDRCRSILRGHTRTAPRGAGMIRFSAQRLWGALAAELHRTEGSDGPMIQACTRIEELAQKLAAAVEALLEAGTEMPLAQRHRLGRALIGAAARAAAGNWRGEALLGAAGPHAGRLSRPAALLDRLELDYRGLRAGSVPVAAALAIATQASAQSAVAARLEQDLQELDRLLGGLAADYRAMVKLAQRGQGRAAVLRRLDLDAPAWREAARALAEPLALLGPAAEAPSQPGPTPAPPPMARA